MSRSLSPDAAALATERAAAVRRLVEATYGFRPSAHTARTFSAALQASLLETGTATAEELHELLLTPAGQAALDTLAGRLTVGETHFFRVAPQIRMLRGVVIPALIGSRASRRRLRIWSAGCATGEEPYTLALLIRERAAALADWDVQIIATDVDRAALEVARDGLYPEWSFRGTPSEIRDRYFTIEGDRRRLARDVRDMVRFEYLNLAAPAPTPRRVVGADFDLILCRNVAIYLAPTVTRQLYRHFGEALARDGWLVLGPADPAPDDRAGFEAVTHHGAVLWRPTTAGQTTAQRPAAKSVPIDDRLSDAVRRGHSPTTNHSASRHSPRAVCGGAAPRPPRATRGPAGAPASPDGAGLDVARTLLRAGDRAAGRAAAERLAGERGLDPAVQLFLGMLYLEDGALEAALGALRRATFLAPDDALAQFTLGRALARGGDPTRARAAFLQARRALVAVPETAQLSTAEPLQASELRAAVEVQLRGLEASVVD